jgi:hypothetical protein
MQIKCEVGMSSHVEAVRIFDRTGPRLHPDGKSGHTLAHDRIDALEARLAKIERALSAHLDAHDGGGK